ncbi:MAG: D-2-hydroxyacid dehydrogenase [Treponema sp.]|nr:D-2-hydroxyacid dehydrogenase [Treponema sp.]
MKQILSVLPINENQKKQLQQAAKKVNANIVFSSYENVTEADVQNSGCVIGNANPDFFQNATKVKWLQTNSAGTDQYIAKGILPEGTILTNATGAYGTAVSEHMLATTLMIIKNLHLYRDNQNKSSWKKFGSVSSLKDATVLIIGAGDIGLHYAKLVKLLGSYTIGVRRRAFTKPAFLDELHLSDEIDNLLPRADIVASILPGTVDTEKFFTARRFSLMKKSAVFLNTGRGSAVDQDALYYALKNHVIAAASIDVTTPEPLPASSPLWSLPNLVLTPHISGGFHLNETMDNIVNIACQNIDNFFNNKTMINEVDFTTGYRK